MRALLLALVAYATPAAADKQMSPEAERHMRAGVAAFDQHDFTTASREFQAAYSIEQTPALLYAWAQAERLGGHCDLAKPLYLKYLDTPNLLRVDIDNTHANLLECEKHSKPPPPPKPEPPPPQAKPVHDEEPPPPPADTAPPWYTNKLGDGLAAGGVVALAVGLTYLAKSSSTSDSAQKPGAEPTLQAFDDAMRTASTQKTVGAISLTLGAALAAGAVYVYVTHARAHEVMVSTNGHSLYLGARF